MTFSPVAINNQTIDKKNTTIITNTAVYNLLNPNGTLNSILHPYGMRSDLRIFGKQLLHVLKTATFIDCETL